MIDYLWLLGLWPLIFFIPLWVWMLKDIRQMNRTMNAWKELGEMKRKQSMAEYRARGNN